MTLAVSAAYQTETDKLERDPLYKVVIAGVSVQFSTHRLGSCKPYMSLPTDNATQVIPLAGISTIGSFEFDLADVNGEVTAVVDDMTGAAIDLYGGYRGMDEDDFAQFPSRVITSITLTEDLAGYHIVCTDMLGLLNKQVFQVSTTVLTDDLPPVIGDLWDHTWDIISPPSSGNQAIHVAYDPTAYGAILDGVYGAGNWTFTANVQFDGSHIYVEDASTFLTPGYVMIGEELIAFTSNTGTVLGGLTRIARATAITSGIIGQVVKEALRYNDHIIEVLKEILTATSKRGLGIPAANVYTAELDAIKSAIGSTYTVDFLITEPENAQDWLAEEIFRFIPGFPVVRGAGMISAARISASGAAVDSITHRNIKEKDGTLKLAFDVNFSSIINSVTFLDNYNSSTGDFERTSTEYKDQVSIDRFGKFPITFKSKGFRSSASGTTEQEAAIAALVIGQYGNGGARKVTAVTFLQKHLIEQGDTIALTSDKIPSRVTRRRGVTAVPFLVVSRANGFAQGSVDFDLLEIGGNT